MKKSLLLTAVLVVLGATVAMAEPLAIGANLGSGLGFSYRHGLGSGNMLDVNVDVPIFNGWGIGGSVTYDWMDPFNTSIPWDNKGEWHWQMGVGAGAGIYGFKDPSVYVGAAGHIGVEYDFWFPFQLSIDWRPNIGVTIKDGAGFNSWGLCIASIGVRYHF